MASDPSVHVHAPELTVFNSSSSFPVDWVLQQHQRGLPGSPEAACPIDWVLQQSSERDAPYLQDQELSETPNIYDDDTHRVLRACLTLNGDASGITGRDVTSSSTTSTLLSRSQADRWRSRNQARQTDALMKSDPVTITSAQLQTYETTQTDYHEQMPESLSKGAHSLSAAALALSSTTAA